VDQGLDTGLHPAFVVGCKNQHHRTPEEAFLFKLRSAKRKISALDGGGDLHPDHVTLIRRFIAQSSRRDIWSTSH
jgi:hypothetical protein